jgi:hypothetical protein
MADGVIITSGSGVTIATDDDGSAQHQYVKVEFGADNSFNKVTNNVPLPISGTTIAITSLPDLGLNSSVKVTSLPDLGAGSAVKITSLPPFPAIINITSLPDLGLNSSVKITSLPAFASGSIVSISNGAILSVTNLISITGTVTSLGGTSATSVTISNLASVPLTVSGTTIAITSLPDLGLNSSVKITSLPSFAANASVLVSSLPAFAVGAITSISAYTFNPTITNLGATANVIASIGSFPVQIIPAKTSFIANSSYTSAQMNVVLKAIAGSTTAYYVTDIIISNGPTSGTVYLLESSSNYASRNKMGPYYLAVNGGVSINMTDGINWDTNSSIVFTSVNVTNHTVTVLGYTA